MNGSVNLIEFVPLDPLHVEPVYANLRPWDLSECEAVSYQWDAVNMAHLVAANCDGRAVLRGGKPVAVISWLQMHPGCYTVAMLATPDWPSVALSVTKWVRRALIPKLLDSGARRVECKSIDGHTDAHRWLLSLGARAESRLESYGKNGETFVLFRWLRADFNDVYAVPTVPPSVSGSNPDVAKQRPANSGS